LFQVLLNLDSGLLSELQTSVGLFQQGKPFSLAEKLLSSDAASWQMAFLLHWVCQHSKRISTMVEKNTSKTNFWSSRILYLMKQESVDFLDCSYSSISILAACLTAAYSFCMQLQASN
jgi:hypothetical protein